MPADATENSRSLAPDFPVFALRAFLASTKRRDVHDRYRLIALILVHFLQDHGLTTRTILRPQDSLPDDFAIRVRDLTDEGLAFYRDAEQKWLRRIDRGTSPTDTTPLVKALRNIQHE